MAHTAAQMVVMVALFSSVFISSAASSVKDFIDASDLQRKSPEAGLCAQLIEPSGFPCSEHKIQTNDGFVLGIQRVSSNSGDYRAQRASPVLLVHGLFVAGDVWFLNTPNQSLGFILAERGFDVWVGNLRGTRWSQSHVSLSVKDKEFWDWSWQELALYDLAEMIRYVYSVTTSRVLIVGHSQGTMVSLAAFTQPDTVEMVKAAALLCPITYLKYITAELPLRLAKLHLDQVMLYMGIHQLNLKSEWGTRVIDIMCNGLVNCDDFLTLFTGKNCCFNSSRVDFYLDYEPHPSSAKNLNHLFQMIREGSFAMYDYGIWNNIKHYGILKPPKFDLSKISSSLPLWIGYGGNDALADVKDLQHTLEEIQSKPDMLYLENYGHLDFILSTRSREDVYDKMLSFFNALGTSSSYE